MTSTFLPVQYKWDHCTHLTWNLGHQLKWDHYIHPLLYHCVLFLGWSFLIRSCLWVSICAPKGWVFLWFVQFWRGWTSDTTAHTLLEIWVTGWSEITTSTPYHITLCFVGWSFLIRLYLWVSMWAPKGSVCLWFVQFCLDRTSETIASIILQN